MKTGAGGSFGAPRCSIVGPSAGRPDPRLAQLSGAAPRGADGGGRAGGQLFTLAALNKLVEFVYDGGTRASESDASAALLLCVRVCVYTCVYAREGLPDLVLPLRRGRFFHSCALCASERKRGRSFLSLSLAPTAALPRAINTRVKGEGERDLILLHSAPNRPLSDARHPPPPTPPPPSADDKKEPRYADAARFAVPAGGRSFARCSRRERRSNTPAGASITRRGSARHAHKLASRRPLPSPRVGNCARGDRMMMMKTERRRRAKNTPPRIDRAISPRRLEGRRSAIGSPSVAAVTSL